MKIAAMILLVACGPEAHDDHEEHEEPEHAGEVELSDAAIERAGIATGRVERVPLGGGVAVPAELRLDPSRTARVAPIASGRVVSVGVLLGDRVEMGQELAVLASAEAGEARASAGEAQARLAAARAAYQRQTQLREAGIGSERALIEAQAELRAAEAALSGVARRVDVLGQRGRGASLVLTAAMAGVVVEHHAVVGEVAATDSPLFVISDPSVIWIEGHVPEMDVAAVRMGAPATLRLSAYPGERWPTEIDFVAPALDETTRTLPVRARISNPDGRLRAGLFGRLSIASGSAEANVLAVPQAALARLDGEDVVFMPAEEPRTFRPQPVRLGRREGDLVEIAEGLREGDTIVTSGAFTLRSELSRSALAEHQH